VNIPLFYKRGGAGEKSPARFSLYDISIFPLKASRDPTFEYEYEDA
jgi:hypothetical protein